MWQDEESDGCIYDTVDCDHTCKGCEYGTNYCDKCKTWYSWQSVCDCDLEFDDEGKGEEGMEVKLLEVTPNAKELIYAACSQCYYDGWVGTKYPMDESEKAKGALIRAVVASGHHSVIEHVYFSFVVDGVSRSLTHQLVRHRIASFSQQSQRYVSNSGDFNINDYVIPPSIEKNEDTFVTFVETLRQMQFKYNQLKDSGVPSEDARFLLPNATKTRIVVTMNCSSLLHFFGVRCCTAAQWEIRKLANTMLAICKEELPVVFENGGSKCIGLGYCQESKKRTCGKYPLKEVFLNGNKDEFSS